MMSMHKGHSNGIMWCDMPFWVCSFIIDMVCDVAQTTEVEAYTTSMPRLNSSPTMHKELPS